jgi:hypothetical protein
MNNTALSGWAQAVLVLDNLVFCVLDTTSLKKDADIIRILVVNLAGEELYNQIVRPLRHPREPNTYYTSITQSQLDQATPLRGQWPAIGRVLAGKFVLAYGQDFVQEHLHENAQVYQLERIYLVGDCLYHTASQYCHRDHGVTLAQACSLVGFPRHIGPSAAERARAQIILLHAMADGQPRLAVVAPPVAIVPVDALEEEEDDNYPWQAAADRPEDDDNYPF